MSDGKQVTEHIPDKDPIGYGVTVVYTLHEHYIDFFAARIFTDTAFKDGVAFVAYESAEGRSSADLESDPLKAEPFVRGSVKWDGCVNFEVGDQGRVMMHACNKGDLDRISHVLSAIYDRCRELMPCGADW